MPLPISPAGQDGLNAMSASASNTEALLKAVVQQLELMRRAQAVNNKEIEVYGSDLRSVLKDTTNIELSFRRINQLQKTVMHQGSTKSQAVDTLKAMTKEYEVMLKTINKTHGGDLYVQRVTKSLEGMRRALKAVESQSEDTWDTKGLREANTQLQHMHRSVKQLAEDMSRVKVTHVASEFRSLGGTIDDAFRNRLSTGMRKIPGVGHAMQAMDMNRRFREAGQGVSDFQRKRILQRDDIAHTIAQQRAAKVQAKFGAAGVRTLNAMGHPAAPVIQGKMHRVMAPGLEQIRSATTRATSGGAASSDKMAVSTMHVDTMVMSGKLKMLNPKGSSPAAAIPTVLDPGGTTAGQVLKRTAQLPGGTKASLLEKFMGRPAATPNAVASLLGGKGGKLASATSIATGMAGGGVVDKVAGIAGTFLKMGPAVSAVVGIVRAAVDLHDKVAENNKKISDTLGGSGMFGGKQGTYEALHNTRKSLISTSFGQQMMYGQGFEKNLDLYKTLGAGGLATGRSLNSGINLEAALSGGEGFHGAVMQNSVHYGKMSGFDQEGSVRMTLKLIEKFGQTTEATKQFFVELNEFSNTSGISASRIVEMVDNVTDQFTDLQKSLIGTVEALHKVGNAGIFMGKRVEETVKGLTKPLEMSVSQRYYNVAQQMRGGGGASMAESIRGLDTAEKSRLLGPNGVLTKYGLNAGSSHGEIMAAIGGATGVDGETKRADMEAYQQFSTKHAMNEANASDWARGNVNGVVSRQMNGGESMNETLGGRVQLVRSLARTGRISEKELQSAMSGDPGAIARIAGNFTMANAGQQGVFGSGENFMKVMQGVGNARAAGAQTITNTALEAPEATRELMDKGNTDQEKSANQAKLRLLEGYGEVASKGGVFQHAKGADYAQEFSQWVKANKNNVSAMGTLNAVLTRHSKLTEEVINHTGDLGAAMDTQTAVEKEKTAKENSAALAINTTTSDMAMARAFEYLFGRVTSSIDKMADLLPDATGARRNRASFKASWDQATTNIQKAVGDPGKLTGKQAEAWSEFLSLKAHADEGTGSEMQSRSDRGGQLADFIANPKDYVYSGADKGITTSHAYDLRKQAEQKARDLAVWKMQHNGQDVPPDVTAPATAGAGQIRGPLHEPHTRIEGNVSDMVSAVVDKAFSNGKPAQTSGVTVHNHNYVGVHAAPYKVQGPGSLMPAASVTSPMTFGPIKGM